MQKYAIIGEHLAHSASPDIHTFAFKTHKIRATYTKIEIPAHDFDAVIGELKNNADYAGFNVTIPYKSRIIPHLDRLDPVAQVMGAVNTIKSAGGEWTGYNTDIDGFMQPLRRYEARCDQCLVLGSGGAARAVVYALLVTGKKRTVSICARDAQKGQKIVQDFQALVGTNRLGVSAFTAAAEIYPDFDLIVNTTPLGMYPKSADMPVKLQKALRKPLIVYDVVYNPPQTAFLRAAKRLNGAVEVISGVDMLIGQAAAAFRLWTGHDFPVEKARERVLKNLSAQ